jgi:hypothetical protein
MGALGIAVTFGITLLLLSVFIDRVLNPLLARRGIKNLLKHEGKQDPRALENSKYGILSYDTDCFRIKNNKGGSLELQWSEVGQVHAFKRDLFTTDLICLAFKKTGKEEYYEIHEEMAGYHDLLEILPTRLPKFTSDWFSGVAFPAFKANHRVIWKSMSN